MKRHNDEDRMGGGNIKVFRINFKGIYCWGNSRELIVGWETRDGGHNLHSCVRGPFVYVPIQLNPISVQNRQFRVLLLNKEINNENWTQYMRSYEKVIDGKSRTVYHCDEMPKYVNRWAELSYGSETGSQDTIEFFRSDPSLKSKIDRIRNPVCITTIYFNFTTPPRIKGRATNFGAGQHGREWTGDNFLVFF